jgi:hypothetical protein
MEAIALEDISAMQSPVVVYEEDITWFHGKGGDVLFTSTAGCPALLMAMNKHMCEILTEILTTKR